MGAGDAGGGGGGDGGKQAGSGGVSMGEGGRSGRVRPRGAGGSSPGEGGVGGVDGGASQKAGVSLLRGVSELASPGRVPATVAAPSRRDEHNGWEMAKW